MQSGKNSRGHPGWSRCRIGVWLVLLAAGWQPLRGETPEPIPGWRMELVAEAPKVRHPSVICSTPDGRVFVAEDPMDISSSRADSREGRILCLHPDGRTTLFADQLYAVFGMQYLEGKLYVLHNPKFSVFDDRNGAGTNRVDLIESTNPNPWALDWNDHVPANFRLAMDGYFYVAVGDKGLYRATGTDGRRVDLHGGGVVRIRPDGTELEVYSTGVRNILDIGMTTEDEIFTYDNTDEQDWMGRLTHMVDGGFYGYPYDFIPRRPYTLWMLADFGGGAATGLLAYTEDALAAEYHGNLFLADFGKRQVMRVRLRRAGASWELVEKIDLFPNPPADFRPVGLAWSADATAIYICDWQHADTKDKVAVGRIWKLSHTAPSQAAPRPRWFLDAALGRPFEATAPELIAGLSHPARAVRMAAQRGLVARSRAQPGTPGDESRRGAVRGELLRLLRNGAAPTVARYHAIWALDAIDAGSSARPAILGLLESPDPAIRRQAIRQLGQRKAAGALPFIMSKLSDPDRAVRFQAATALGRLGDTVAVEALSKSLIESDFFARYALFTALNRIGRQTPEAWPAIAAGLRHPTTAVREGTVFALRAVYDARLVGILAELLADRDAPVTARAACLALLSEVHHQTPAWQGEWWAYHPVNSPPPLKTVSWPGTDRVLEAFRNGLGDPVREIRLGSIRALGEARDTNSVAALRKIFDQAEDVETGGAAIAALGLIGDDDSRETILGVLRRADGPAAVILEAITAAQRSPTAPLLAALEGLLARSRSEVIKVKTLRALGQLKAAGSLQIIAAQMDAGQAALTEAALEALLAIGGDAALTAILDRAPALAPDLRNQALRISGRFRNKKAVPPLLAAYQNTGAREAAFEGLAQVPDPRATRVYLENLAGKNAARREKARKAISALGEAALPEVEAALGDLPGETIAELQSIYAGNSRAKAGPLFGARVEAETFAPGAYLKFVLDHGGEAARGRSIFTNLNGVACIKCHSVAKEGGRVGPDLTTIGGQQNRAALAESILFPGKVIREGYQQTVIETKNGEQTSGLFQGETAGELLILDEQGTIQQVPKSEIKGRQMSNTSMMPEGLQAALTLQEFADLISYLESLK